jgi:predicted Zn-dependent protease
MQERISRIGASLIPPYQRQLPAGDPTKIAFQFQVVDRPNSHEAFVFPSGIILIPHQVVERLQNDSQVAAVLAYNMAIALEKQEYRMQPAHTSMSVADIATAAGGAFVPGLSLASLAMYPKSKSMETDLFNQSGRVSLGLLHDAGYDIQQAPVAWWILASKRSKSLSETSVPPRAINLYQAIGLVWKSCPETAVGIKTSTTTSSTN